MAADPTSPLEREIAVEQAHVDQVYDRLAVATDTARSLADEGAKIYQSDRTSFVREEDGTGLYERDVFAFQSARRLATLDAEHEGLVFGRLDHSDDDARYVGRIGVRDEEYEPLVIDWRARAAEPFYRATPAEPMGVVRRRVLRCRGDRVVGIEDDLLDSSRADDLVVIGEGALMAALSRARGHQMRDIVATIQAEQDEAIRADHQGVTIISGGPGTGKTVVALHRAAYLLYSHRRRFENGGVLVVGPSAVFMNYIERVLPSLGEDSVTLRSVGSLARDVVDVRAERVDDVAAHAVKGSGRMVDVLRRLVDEPLVDGPTTTLRVSVKGEVLTVPPERLARLRRSVLANHRLNQARPVAERSLLDSLWGRWTARFDAQAGQAPDLEREQFDDLVTTSAKYRMFIQAWWPSLSAPRVLRRLADPALARRVSHGVLDASEAATLSASYTDHTDFSVADVALLDELVAMLGPEPEPEDDEPDVFLDQGSTQELVTTADRLSRMVEEDPNAEPHETYAHVLVDEAQDITPMQWRMLRRRGSRASWTIVGDPAQSSWPDPSESARALDDLIGRGPSRRFRMSTNYRSPAEVFELAATVLRESGEAGDLPRAARRTGVTPSLRVSDEGDLVADVDAAVTELAGEVAGTIGVIAPPSRLADVTERLLATRSKADAARLAIVPPLASKGLEYDAVVVVSPDEIVAESPGGVRVLYVALTRPTQRLVTIDVDEGAWRPRELTAAS